jgi:phosphoglycolate phosphatase
LCGGTQDTSLLIGDSSYDALGAQEAGIDFLGVTYGFGFSSLSDANYYPNIGCAETVKDVLNIISSI